MTAYYDQGLNMEEIEKSPFSIYVEGYVDGYAGFNARMPNDDTYMQGYEAGDEDDMLGLDSRYTIDHDPVAPEKCLR